MTVFRLLLAAFLLVIYYSCDNDEVELRAPDCVNTLIKQDMAGQAVILVRANNQDHYWIHTGVIYADGPEFVLNASCDTVCTFCAECTPPACANSYAIIDTIWAR